MLAEEVVVGQTAAIVAATPVLYPTRLHCLVGAVRHGYLRDPDGVMP
jgi:hypothetical protein